MHTRILITCDDPMTLIADCTLLKDRGMYVYTASNLDNIPELIAEVKPDVVFFDAVHMDEAVHTAYNNMMGNTSFKDIPVVYTLTEDDMYLVTPKRADGAPKKSRRATSVLDAVKMALTVIPNLQKHYVSRQRPNAHTQQLQLPLYTA